MKTNVRIVLILLAAALVFGVVSCSIDSIGGGKEYITPTPQGGEPTPTNPSPTASETPTPTLINPSPTASETPTPEPTDEPTPTPENPSPTEGPKRLTEDEAVAYVKSISADRLQLPGDISLYRLEVDSWTSMIYGVDCYCVNVLHPDGYMVGMYFVAVDGSVVYRMNEDEEPEVISE